MNALKLREHGPLPAMLIVLTFLTGIVDAVSFLKLGHVFVANMTGNVVFLGFAAAGGTEVAEPSSITAILSFLAGAVLGGRLARALNDHRGRIVCGALAVKVILMSAAAAIAVTLPGHPAERLYLIVLLAVAMGVQNAAVRALNVPDLTTTVLTLTLTGIAADSLAAPGSKLRLARRLVSVGAMACGAFAGGLLGRHFGTWAALAFAAAITVAAAVVAASWVQVHRAWVNPA